MSGFKDLSKNLLGDVAKILAESKNKSLASLAEPTDKVTKKDVLVGRGVLTPSGKLVKEGSKLDPVGQEDADVDNDGKTGTKSDNYLLNRRKVRSQAIQKEEAEQVDENILRAADQAVAGAIHGTASLVNRTADAIRNSATAREIRSHLGPSPAVKQIRPTPAPAGVPSEPRRPMAPTSPRSAAPGVPSSTNPSVRKMPRGSFEESVKQVDENSVPRSATTNRAAPRAAAPRPAPAPVNPRNVPPRPRMSDPTMREPITGGPDTVPMTPERRQFLRDLARRNPTYREEVEHVDEGKMDGVAKGSMEGKKHMCATKVFHKEWAEGTPIKTMHADPDDNGNIEWYDVMFEHGIERVMTEEMDILQMESHMHSKKMEEGYTAASNRAEASRQRAIKKAAAAYKRHGNMDRALRDHDLVSKRDADLVKAHLDEEVEQIDEISKKKAEKYIDAAMDTNSEKSVSNLASKGGFEQGERGDEDPKAGEEEDAKSVKRSKMVMLAAKKLSGSAKVPAVDEEVDLEEDNTEERQKIEVTPRGKFQSLANAARNIMSRQQAIQKQVIDEAKRGRPKKNAEPEEKEETKALGFQLRKVSSMNKPVTFDNGEEAEVHPNHVALFNDHMDARKTSQEKAAFQKMASASHEAFKKAVTAPVPSRSKDTGEIVKYGR